MHPSGPQSLTAPLAEALRNPHPLAFLEYASMLAQATEPDPLAGMRHMARGGGAPSRPKIDRDDLIDSFFDVGMRETDALLMVWAQMLDDDRLRERAQRELPLRRHSLPAWLRQLDKVQPTRVIQGSHLLGDGENFFIGVETAGRSFTIVLYIDHNMGTIPKDGFAVDLPLTEVVGRMHEGAAEDDIVTEELLLEDARAKIDEALENESHLLDPFEGDSWPGTRPLTRWMLRLLPSGGTGYQKAEATDQELDAIVEAFLASEFAAGAAPDIADQVRTLLNFGPYYSGTEPLRWSPVVAEMVLVDLIPRKVMADAAYLAGIPDAMRALVRFAHAERSVPARYTAETLHAIDEFEPQYRDLIAADQRPGTLGMVQQVLGASDPFGAGGLFEEDISTDEYFLRRVALRTGGMPALDALDTAALPDEPLTLPPLTRSTAVKIEEVAEIVDGACIDFFADAELRTAARRLISRIAEADADVLARGKSTNAAAALCWIIANANDAFAAVTVKGLTESLGVKSSPQDRALTMLSALGVDHYEWRYDHALGDAALLTSRTRTALIARRDRLRAAIAAEQAD
ncbi:DUF6398 domain-containing protein [Microbacterium sp. Mu-80]|uniref:DUF6398 domain-containing protein n=1 Tax=Microbacterium bandirmense TaxID=3122050 RepID=A0ABU8LEC9_9MICO